MGQEPVVVDQGDGLFTRSDWRDLEVHPAARHVRMMSMAEAKRLEESLVRNGFLRDEPIILHENKILDGRSRHAECLHLDGEGVPIEPLFKNWNGVGSPDDYSDAKNLDRRHLTRAEQEARVQERLIEEPGASNRKIAREIGVSHTTVAKKRGELVESGTLANVASRTGADGQVRRLPRKKVPGLMRPWLPSQGAPEVAAAVPAETPAPPTPAEPDPAPRIEELDFTTRTYNCLKKGNIQTIADLVQTTEADLMNIRNFDRESLLEVRAKLAERGLTLAGPPLPDPVRDDWDDEEVEAPTPMPPEAAPTPAAPAPEDWERVEVPGRGEPVLWVPEWPDEGTDEDRKEWAWGCLDRLEEAAGLEAVAAVAREGLLRVIAGHRETARELLAWAVAALEERE
jgi:hypothetical protein